MIRRLLARLTCRVFIGHHESKWAPGRCAYCGKVLKGRANDEVVR